VRRCHSAGEPARWIGNCNHCKRRQDRQWAQLRRRLSIDCDLPRAFEKLVAGMRIRAMPGPIDQRPQLPSAFGITRVAAEQPRPDTEEDPSAQLQGIRLRRSPRERLQQRQPRILKSGKLPAAYAERYQLTRYGQQPRLRRRFSALVQFLQPLAPPGKTDRAETWIGAARNHVREGEVKVPKCGEGGPYCSRQLFERDLAVGIERTLSDSRRLSPPRPPRTP
jgi:hypothetical protein